MKKMLFALVALFSAFSAKAQLLNFDGMPPYRLGVFAGYNASSFSSENFESTNGVYAGLDLMLSGGTIDESLRDLYARIDLEYSMKGAVGTDPYTTNGGDPIRVNCTTHYLEIPIHVGYAWTLTDNLSVMAETGPYVAFGLGGNAKLDGQSISGWNDKPFFNGSKYGYDCRRFDYGWGVRAGFLFNQIFEISCGYEWGFRNMDTHLLQNRNFSAGLTIYFDYKN